MDPAAGAWRTRRRGMAGAVVLPWSSTAAAAPAPARAAAAAARLAWTRLTARLAWAAALFLLGCAAAGLAFFAIMTLPPPDYRLRGACTPTHAEAAGLRAASEKLLLAASAQVLGATMGLLVPARALAVFGCALGWLTAYHADGVLWMLVACHDRAQGALAYHYWLFYAVLCSALALGAVVSVR